MVKDIKYLPGWRWVSAGKEEWIANRGTKSEHRSTQRHAIDPEGNARSVRYTQDRQKEAEAESGVVRPEPVPRRGKIRTIFGQTGGRKTQGKGSGRGQIILVFRDFVEAREYVKQHSDEIRKFTYGLIQIRYSARLKNATRPGTDTSPTNGYSTLTGYQFAELPADKGAGPFVLGAYTSASIGLGNPWEDAARQLTDFDMSGENARVYIYLTNQEQ